MNRERIKRLVERQKADIKSILESSESGIKRLEQRIAEIKKQYKGNPRTVSIVSADLRKELKNDKQWLNRYKKKINSIEVEDVRLWLLR